MTRVSYSKMFPALCAAAFFAVGSLQAAAIDWSLEGSTPDKTTADNINGSHYTLGTPIANGTSYTASISFLVPAATFPDRSYIALAAIGQTTNFPNGWGGSGGTQANTISIRLYAENKSLRFYLNGNEVSVLGTELTADTIYHLVFTYDKGNISYTFGDNSGSFALSALADSTVNAVFLHKDAAFSGATISTSGVPEPTALALLALGFAGVALRRRVA